MNHAATRHIRIGGASGYWGDSADAPRQLLEQGNVDYLVLDYLAEVTMSILVRARQKSPELGYARDFIDLVMKPLLPTIMARGVKVVVNAGGVNVAACAAAVRALAEAAGLDVRVGIVAGDDLMPQVLAARDRSTRTDGVEAGNTGTGVEPVAPAAFAFDTPRLISANAYLGAFPIAAALGAGADIVITGRCVDSALTLGPLIHEFGWAPDDFDRLAAGSLAGHLLECGAQATGGNFTDWQAVASGWHDMGYPVAACAPDGSFVITKPENTGGLVSPLTVGEQMLYEIGDPSAYQLPDVTCDFSGVTLTQISPDQVAVAGARGTAPSPTLKVSLTCADGFRATSASVISGFDAVAKAQHCAQALFARLDRFLQQAGLSPWRGTAVHLIGAQTLRGPHADATASAAREIVLQIDVHHDERAAVELFSKESVGVALSMATGRCAAGGAGRPRVTPVVAHASCLWDRAQVLSSVSVDGAAVDHLQLPVSACAVPASPESSSARDRDDSGYPVPDRHQTRVEPHDVQVPLIALAVARSGDKGNDANIGVIARHANWLPFIRAALTEASVRAWFSHNTRGEVRRYALPGTHALNFVLTDTLDGGGTSSLHLDSQAKTYAQQLLAMPVTVPRQVAHEAGQEAATWPGKDAGTDGTRPAGGRTGAGAA